MNKVKEPCKKCFVTEGWKKGYICILRLGTSCKEWVEYLIKIKDKPNE